MRTPSRMRAVAALALATAALACGSAPEPAAPPPAPTSAAPKLTRREASFGKFHSKRFQLTVPLPDGRAWRIDDHSHPYLYAVHEASSSRLWLALTREDELMNHDRCEERARAAGLVPAGDLTTVEDRVTIGPGAFDSRVWVALDPGPVGGPIEGHVLLFGAYIRTCLFVHVATRVPSFKELDALSSRLALAEARVVRGITLDPPRTTPETDLPRDEAVIRR